MLHNILLKSLIKLNVKVVTLSDSSGCIYDPDGIDNKKLAFVKQLKNVQRGRIASYVEKYPSAEYISHNGNLDYNPIWNFPADLAFPSATQNEINAKDAQHLVDNNIKLVAEGANMPTSIEGINIFLDNNVLFAPAKAANAGGVAVSGLEMAQNSSRVQWSAKKVDDELLKIMKGIYKNISTAASQYSTKSNLVDGANIAGFLKVANAMIDQGYV